LLNFLQADWPVPASVKTLITTREGGVSDAPYASLNLGGHVGDKSVSVAKNRALLSKNLPREPYWLNQVHGIDVLEVGISKSVMPNADGSYTSEINRVCCVMTADCLPVLLCNAQGTKVAAVHAGWRGLLDGILDVSVSKFDPNDKVLAYLGPAIGPASFEVGEEVREAFVTRSANTEVAFRASGNSGKWLADLYSLARIRLNSVGGVDIFGGERCTFIEADKFFSYRRDGQTGRMASCIWIEG
jgi:YfiH family protein